MDDTICAISTSLGVGAISIIRLSGYKAIETINSIFSGSKIDQSKHKTISYGHIIYKKELIDEVLISIMIGPHSYTREDIVEINCHGGIATTKKILNILLESGCRLAEPGEFTKRAFLNGRIDLTEAEALNELLLAETENARKISINTMGGLLNKKITSLRKVLGDLLSNIEVNIDFPEYEDNLVVTNKMIMDSLGDVTKELEEMIVTSAKNKIITTGINIALIGRPNVGKSSLLNAFLDEEKAIVTDIAGTTRDIVEGKCSLNDIMINFIDTAGIRNTNDIVEKIGVEKSLQTIKYASLVILVLDGSSDLTFEDLKLISKLDAKKSLIFVNKNDLEIKLSLENTIPIIYGNTKTIEGISTLKQEIINMFNLDKLEVNNNSFINNLRQENLIKSSLDSLKNVLKNLEICPIDIVSIDIKKAWVLLGEITGESYNDELLDILFKNFCLGK